MPKAKQQTKGPGRPRIEIDWEQAAKMFESGAKVRGVAARIGCDEDTLAKRCREDLKTDLSEFRQQKRAKGDQLLEETQFRLAVGYRDGNGNWYAPNPTLLIWLGKQRLGQADKSETKADVEMRTTPLVIQGVPGNDEPAADT